MPKDEINYRDLHDDGLISFCTNNLTPNALMVLGVFVDTDGMKVASDQYAYLIQLYLEIGAQTGGKFNGMLDFDLGDGLSTPKNAETDRLM
jgi:hypothetical protein